jgi:Amt family ammonium transporter
VRLPELLATAVTLLAVAWCAVLVVRLRDWRLAVLAVLMAVLAAAGPDGGAAWVSLTVAGLALASVAVLSRVFADHRRALRELQHQRTHLDQLVQHAPEAIALVDNDDRVQRINAEFTRLFGYAADEAVGRLINDLIAPPTLHEEALGLTRRVARGESISHETVRRRKDGTLVDVWILGTPVAGPDGQLGVYGIYRDISDRKAAEEQLLHLAIRDELTGLANRALFRDLVARSIGRGKRRDDYTYSVLVLDLDRFKLLNESLGHATGDQLLRAIARRLERCVRPGDTVARLGGDEFALFLDDVRDLGDAIRVADRIQSELAQPFILGTQEVFVSASVGIALSSGQYEAAEDLLRDADLAMYRAKERGGARHEVFQTEMFRHAVALLQLETDLRHALDRGEFELHYQPIVTLSSGQVSAVEALVRWRHRDRGIVQPASFIPIAEQTGLIVPLGRWVLWEACRQASVWRDRGRSVPVSVNLSGKQLLRPELVEEVADALAATGLDPRLLRIEITESAVVENAEDALRLFARLHELQVQIHMDDFGTGYSSLSYLHRFQVDTLKIDRSFIAAMGERAENTVIVRTIVTLARNLGIEVIAEGVETPEQLAQLRALGCEHAQGYYYSQPVPSEEAEALIGLLRAS